MRLISRDKGSWDQQCIPVPITVTESESAHSFDLPGQLWYPKKLICCSPSLRLREQTWCPGGTLYALELRSIKPSWASETLLVLVGSGGLDLPVRLTCDSDAKSSEALQYRLSKHSFPELAPQYSDLAVLVSYPTLPHS